MKFLREAKDLKGKKVLVRVDFNVPIANGKITNYYRIQRALPTLDFLKAQGAKIILMSHIESDENTLLPVFEYLKTLLSIEFVRDFNESSGKEMLEKVEDGHFVLLENVRNYAGEKKNDSVFAQELASLAQIFVNDAFAVCHREHASVVGIPKFLPSYCGLLLEDEIKNLSKVLHPEHPFLFILSGAKFETKLPLLQKFFALADEVFVGGALANDLLKAKGMEVGISLVSDTRLDLKEMAENPKLLLPIDVTVDNVGKISIKETGAVLSEDKILDAGPKTIEMLRDKIMNAKCILWNGPLGAYEAGFTEPTFDLAKVIAESDAESIVGGGDTLATIEKLGLFEKFSFVSTGGGAMLDFLATETLPGIEALR